MARGVDAALSARLGQAVASIRSEVSAVDSYSEQLAERVQVTDWAKP